VGCGMNDLFVSPLKSNPASSGYDLGIYDPYSGLDTLPNVVLDRLWRAMDADLIPRVPSQYKMAAD
jgi:hypothetical protein